MHKLIKRNRIASVGYAETRIKRLIPLEANPANYIKKNQHDWVGKVILLRIVQEIRNIPF